jgi:hypothetical protein
MTRLDDRLTMSDGLGKDVSIGQADTLTIRGEILLELFGPDGRLLETRQVENIVTQVGRNMIIDRLTGSPTLASPTHMGLGTGATAAAIGDTTLQTEIAGSRVALTSKTRATSVLTLVGDFPAGTGTGAVTEAGTFDAATTGNMHSRGTFSVINKGAADTLKLTWTWTL